MKRVSDESLQCMAAIETDELIQSAAIELLRLRAEVEEREALRAEWLTIVRNALGLKDGEGVVDAIERLRALEPYVQHLPECDRSNEMYADCTCGLDKPKKA